jgi:hypothetical protein
MSELAVGQLKGLPINNNIVTVPAAHKLYAPGHVIQVVSATTTTPVSTTASSFVTTGLSASITPLSTSSKILVMARTTGAIGNASTTGTWTLFRGTVAGTNLGNGGSGMLFNYIGSNIEMITDVSCSALDSPNTASSQTYTLGFQTNGSGQPLISQRNNTTATMTLMEIAQ